MRGVPVAGTGPSVASSAASVAALARGGMPQVDATATWKPYRVSYEVMKAMRALETGATVEVISRDDPGLLTDLTTWCEVTGNHLVATERPAPGRALSLIRKGEPRRSGRSMTVIVSTAGLEHVIYPLDKALAAAVLGMDVHLVFEGAGVRLLKRGYRSRLSGAVGRAFTAMVERVMNTQIGWPLPAESIAILADLGASFYICGPSMVGYRVRPEDLAIKDYTVAAVVTWADLLARTDVHVFSNAQFEKP
jgi:predicted peroxiredoxin/TusA-related sulfurtransferase